NRITLCPDDEAHKPPTLLSVGPIHFSAGRLSHAQALHVPDQADNFNARRSIADIHAPPYNMGAELENLHKGFIHDHHRRRVGSFILSEVAPLQKWDVHRAEIARADLG